jgi:hypothetical protein
MPPGGRGQKPRITSGLSRLRVLTGEQYASFT